MSAGVVYQGWLKKKSPKKVLGQSVWQQRWFVLQAGQLMYYKSDKIAAQSLDNFLGILLLENVARAVEKPASSNPKKWRFDLIFRQSSSRVFQLFAESSKLGQEWMQHIRDCLGQTPADSRPSVVAKQPEKWWKKRNAKKRKVVFDRQEAETDESKQNAAPQLSDQVPAEERQGLLSALSVCVAFQGLDADTQDKLISVMCKKNIASGSKVISKGERTQTLYYVVSGSFQKLEHNGNTSEVCEGDIFGELDIMYDQPSSVTVTATDTSVCWCLHRYNFKSILKSALRNKFKKYEAFLTSTELLGKLNHDQLVSMSEALEESTYTIGEDIVTQGEEGDTFFLLKHGECEVLKDGAKVHHYKTEGDFFGERALLNSQKRAATVRATTPVTVLKLDRATFVELMGDLSVLLNQQIEMQNKVNEQLDKLKIRGDHLMPIDEHNPLVKKFLHNRVICKTNQGVLIGDVRFAGNASFMEGEWLGVELTLPLGKNDGSVKGEQYFECKPKYGIFCRPFVATLENEADDSLKRQVRTSLSEEGSVLLPGPPATPVNLPGPPGSPPPSNTFKTNSQKPKTIEAIPLDKLKLIGLLGSGSFGRVELREHIETGYTYALKAINKESIKQNGQLEFIKNERAVLAVLDSPFIVKLHGAMVDNHFVYFVLEPAMGGEMFTLLNEEEKFSEDAVRFYTASVVMAFEHMHSQAIVYRDLKPENVMLDHEGYVKITDFGFAKPLEGRTYTFCGTPDYLSPEIVLSQGHSFGTDWWTLGVLMYEMLTGTTPFYDEEVQTMYEKIAKGEFDFPGPNPPSDHAQDLVRRFLQIKPTKRLGIINGGVKKIKQHPFFEGFDWDALYNRQLQAPYKKDIKDKYDLSNFDPEEE
mmetsp:Transcript_2007/g.2696  ORF Transcript_2007/g.2696 Transcript_2007/m.2696 type:complete len:871 (+) Transcript_2007:61-2673(+)|eukprot:CAMPEP_0175088536 /NCGR_PEP_ID=MMETSP0086_2-20121207/300_1 /TAXON_ID=136419 /ORGANISM="Unknown Unknown, Strain D1" /LENGTH=870 /DNA_ID=CAMNT_0016360975 /DNA_START=61 /DNA_END=2673 /DNA_ORIENTATION=+